MPREDTLAHLRAALRESEARLEARMDKLAQELRELIEKRVSMDRYRPVEMLAFGAIALTAGTVIAFILGVLQ